MQAHGTFQRGQIGLLAVGHAAVDLYGGFLSPLIPALREKIGFSLTEGVFLVSLMGLICNFSQVGFGMVSDRLQSASLVSIGIVLSALGFSMLGLSTSYSMAMILVVIGALGIGAFHPEGAGLAGKQSGDKHGTGMGIFSTGGAAGVSIGAVLVTALVSAWGLHATIYGAVIGISIAVLMWRKVRHVHFDHAKTTNNGLSRRGSFLVLGVVAWMAVIRAFVMTAFHALLPTWYADQGASLYYIGVLIGAFTFFGGMGSLLGGILADKFGEKHILWSSFVLPVPLLVLFVMMNGTGGLVLISLGGMTLMLSISSVVAIAQRTFPKNVNTASSVVMGLSWGLGALLVIPTGALAETYGIYPVLLGITLTPLLAAMSAPLLSGRLPDRVGQTIELEEEVSYGAGPTIL